MARVLMREVIAFAKKNRNTSFNLMDMYNCFGAKLINDKFKKSDRGSTMLVDCGWYYKNGRAYTVHFPKTFVKAFRIQTDIDNICTGAEFLKAIRKAQKTRGNLIG